jgi:hypothetical protein
MCESSPFCLESVWRTEGDRETWGQQMLQTSQSRNRLGWLANLCQSRSINISGIPELHDAGSSATSLPRSDVGTSNVTGQISTPPARQMSSKYERRRRRGRRGHFGTPRFFGASPFVSLPERRSLPFLLEHRTFDGAFEKHLLKPLGF